LRIYRIVIPIRGGAHVNVVAVKTSAGAFHYLPICREKHLGEAVQFLKESGFSVIACSEKTNKHLSEMEFTAPTALIMGSEERGISEELMDMAHDVAKVKMTGKIESLNVSVAMGMALYEIQRQRG